MITSSLYLVLERSKPSWRGVRISSVTKRKPTLKRPLEQALVRLLISLPDDVLEPRVVRVEINADHIVPPAITVSSSTNSR